MAEERATSPAVEAQSTTAPEATSETKTDAPAAPAEAENKDTEMTDANPAVAGAQETTDATAPDGKVAEAEPASPDDGPATAATPASAKGKRKSTAGVPEHKGKKLNKKKSMVNLVTSAKPGDYYFAKFKGYAPWPSIICDESMLPETLLATRPVSTENSQGELRDDFKDGGKNVKDRTYPIMFLETNEFAWIVNTALTPLNPGDASEENLKGKMAKSLKDAYALAEKRHPIEFYKKILEDFQDREKERQEELAKKQAEKASAAAKKQERAEKAAEKKDVKEKRKSVAKSKDTISDEDDMDVDDAPEAQAKPSKKRKKEAESEGEDTPKPKKTPKTIKIKASDKTPNGDSSKKARVRKAVAKPEAEPKEKEETLTEEQKLDRREKAVLYLRHRLQKGFLSRDQAPKEEEMDNMAEFFTQLESYSDLEPQVIRTTKINKVLKGVVKLPSIPKEEVYNFKKRCNDLLTQWNNAMDLNKGETPVAATADATAVDAAAEAKSNGNAEEEMKDAEDDAAVTKEPEESTEPGADTKDDKPTEAAEASATAAPTEDTVEAEAEDKNE